MTAAEYNALATAILAAVAIFCAGHAAGYARRASVQRIRIRRRARYRRVGSLK